MIYEVNQPPKPISKAIESALPIPNPQVVCMPINLPVNVNEQQNEQQVLEKRASEINKQLAILFKETQQKLREHE